MKRRIHYTPSITRSVNFTSTELWNESESDIFRLVEDAGFRVAKVAKRVVNGRGCVVISFDEDVRTDAVASLIEASMFDEINKIVGFVFVVKNRVRMRSEYEYESAEPIILEKGEMFQVNGSSDMRVYYLSVLDGIFADRTAVVSFDEWSTEVEKNVTLVGPIGTKSNEAVKADNSEDEKSKKKKNDQKKKLDSKVFMRVPRDFADFPKKKEFDTHFSDYLKNLTKKKSPRRGGMEDEMDGFDEEGFEDEGGFEDESDFNFGEVGDPAPPVKGRDPGAGGFFDM
jgi:hypothetical protein